MSVEQTTSDIHPEDVLEAVFQAAKAADEFEYVCAMLRIRGMEDPGWDRLEETDTLVSEIMSLAQTPLLPHTRLRLGLLTYCHVVEADPIYEVLENMLRAIQGERCSIDPFQDLHRVRKPATPTAFAESIPPSAKLVVQRLSAHARTVGHDSLAHLLEQMFNDGIRNAFFHSDYVLYKDEFRSREAVFGPDRRHRLPIDEVVEILNRGLGFYKAFMDTWRAHRLSYKEPKVVEARIRADGGRMPVTLIVEPPHGVLGFSGPP